jgi:hypothetical protein
MKANLATGNMSPRIILFVSLRKAATFRRKPNDEYSTEVTREVFSLERSPMKLWLGSSHWY